MLSAALALILLSETAPSVTVGIQIAEADQITKEVTEHLGALVKAEIQKRTGVSPLVALPGSSLCDGTLSVSACVTHTVVIRAYGGPSRIQIFAERSSPRPMEAKALLPLSDRDQWPKLLQEAVASLFPEPLSEAKPKIRTEPSLIETTVKPEERSSNVPAWVALGASGIASGVSLGFLVSHGEVQSSLAGKNYSSEEYEAKTSQLERDSIIAGASLAVAVGALTTGIVLLLLDR